MTIVSDLARFAVEQPSEGIPELALERAEMIIASTVSSVAAGINIASARFIREIEFENAGASHSTVWFDSVRLPVAAAARVNAVASDAAAADDSDMRSIAHIGTVVATTALAAGEKLGKSGRDVLDAMIVGYEVAGRIDESLTPGRMQKGFHGSVSTVFGGAVAVGKLMGLDSLQMSHAIAIAATSIGGMAIAADTSAAREYHAGMAAMTGVMAAQAAQRGFTAELSVLEAKRGFLSAMGGVAIEDITADLGRSWDICTDMAIKLMPGAHPFHAIAEAAHNISLEANIRPEEIEEVVISAVQMKDWMSPNHPRNLISAAHSVVYFVAAAIVDKGFTWIHMNPEKMIDPVIRSLQDKVVFDLNPAPLPDRFTHRHGGTVTMRLRDGRQFTNTCQAARGSGPRGIFWKDVDEKYRWLMPQSSFSSSKIEDILATVHETRNLPTIEVLTQQLRRTV